MDNNTGKSKDRLLAESQLQNRMWDAHMQHISNMAARMGRMAHVTFELTPMCTLKCRMCYVRLDKNQVDEIGPMRTAEEWIDMARQFRDAGGLTILITGGEAMSRKDFLHIYEEISKMGLLIILFTNGTTITDEVIEMFMKRPPLLIGLTFYGASEETYELVTGVRAYGKVMDGLKRLRTIPNLRMDIRYTACSLNYKDYPILQKYLYEEMGIILSGDEANMAPVRGARSEGRYLRLTEEQSAEFKASLSMAAEPILKVMHDMEVNGEAPAVSREKAESSLEQQNANNDSIEARRLQCRAASFGVYIAYDGRMYPCDTFSEPYCTYPFRDGYVKACEEIKVIARDILVPQDCFMCKNIGKCGPCSARLIANKEDCKRAGEPCGFLPGEAVGFVPRED